MHYINHVPFTLASKFLHRHVFYWRIFLLLLRHLSFVKLLHTPSACLLYFFLRFIKVLKLIFLHYILYSKSFHYLTPPENEQRKLKYFSVCNWIFSGIWYLLSILFIKTREMETHASDRSSQDAAKLLFSAFAPWINFSLTFICSKKSLDSRHSYLSCRAI